MLTPPSISVMETLVGSSVKTTILQFNPAKYHSFFVENYQVKLCNTWSDK